MKISTIIILLFILVVESKGQASATAGVSVEIIQAVSASADAVTGFNLRNTIGTEDTAIADPAQMNLDLGTITINTGKNVACSVVIQPGRLSDHNGNFLTIEPTVSAREYKSGREITQTVHIKGKPVFDPRIESGNYKGNYTMVFAYN